MSNVQGLVDDLNDAEIQQNEAKLHEQLQNLIRKLPQVEDVFVLDKDGRPLVAANVFPMPANVTAADRPYFIAHRDGKEVAVTSARPSAAGSRAPTSSSTASGGSGRTAASTASSWWPYRQPISRKLFEQAVGERQLHDVPRARRWRIAGALIRPPRRSTTRLEPGSRFMQAIAADREAGTYSNPKGSFDGVARARSSYRKLPDLPVYVAVGVASDAGTRDVDASVCRTHLLFGLPATLALFALALLASRRAASQGETLDRLREEQIRRATAEESLRQSQKMTAVGQLTAGIAHDFNNLLTGIGGAIEMVGRRVPQPSPDVVRFLDLARTGVARAATLTQRMLAFARQQPLQIESIDANRLVTGMSELLRRTIWAKLCRSRRY